MYDKGAKNTMEKRLSLQQRMLTIFGNHNRKKISPRSQKPTQNLGLRPETLKLLE